MRFGVGIIRLPPGDGPCIARRNGLINVDTATRGRMRDGAAAFLAAHGWRGVRLEPLPADASFRCYVRLRGGRRSALLMDAPPPREDVRPYLRIAAHLRAIGLSVPDVIAADEVNGFVIIEDFAGVVPRASIPADDLWTECDRSIEEFPFWSTRTPASRMRTFQAGHACRSPIGLLITPISA